MAHDIHKTEKEAITPTRLSFLLRVPLGTLYKAFKNVCKGVWGVNSPLSEADENALIFYYAELGNMAAKKLAENRRIEKETQKKPAENATPAEVAPPETKTETPRKASRWYFIADAIFFAVIISTGYELYFFLGGWGLGLWAIYAGATTISLILAKDTNVPKTAEAGFLGVIIFEVLAFFAHFSMANLLVVRAAKRGELPFTYDYWGALSAPFYIAVAIAAVLSGIVIYAVWIRLSITKELSK